MEPHIVGKVVAAFMYGEYGNVELTFRGMKASGQEVNGSLIAYPVEYWNTHNPCEEKGKYVPLLEVPISTNMTEFTESNKLPNTDALIAVLICDNHPLTEVSVKVTMKNGESHLSREDMPLPTLYIVATLFWVVFLVAWVVNWIYCRQHVTKLHILITVFVGVKVLSVIYLVIYWHNLQRTGVVSMGITIGENIMYIAFVSHQPAPLALISFATAVMFAVCLALFLFAASSEMCMFFSVLLLVAVGWGMVDNERARRWYVIAGLVVAYGVCLGLSLFLGGWVSIAPIIVLCATIYTVYLLSMETTRILATKVAACATAIEKAGTVEEDINVPLKRAEKEHYSAQMTMIARFRVIIMAYLVLEAVAAIILLFVLLRWVQHLSTELLELLLFACIGWVFRLRPVKKEGMYFLLENEFDEFNASKEGNEAEVGMDALGASAQPAEATTTTTTATLTIISKDEEAGTSEQQVTKKTPMPEPSFVIEDVYGQDDEEEEQPAASSKA